MASASPVWRAAPSASLPELLYTRLMHRRCGDGTIARTPRRGLEVARVLRHARKPMLAAIAALCLLAGGVGRADAHGTPDQFLQLGPGCLSTVLKASAPTTGALRQEFVPAASSLSGVDVCLTIVSTAPVNLSIRSGTAASPGAVLASASTPANPTPNAWVHLELASPLAVTPGTPLVIEINGFPAFQWRGTCGQIGGACTSVDPDLYPAGVSNAAPVIGDFGFITYAPADADGDGIFDGQDNCPNDPNAGQENNDRDFIELGGYGKPFDDVTWPNSDTAGDACDGDDDNDELGDSTETSLPGAACPAATGPTDPLLRDTDGDRALDGAECALGFDPVNAASKPPTTLPIAEDPDRDGLSTAFEANLGTNPNVADTDGDKMSDGLEFRSYNSSPAFVNTDLDLCNDAREAASVNGDTQVNVLDLLVVAQSSGPAPGPPYVVHFDYTRNGTIDVLDLQQVAQQSGVCP
jgi:hypothetical protein